MLTLLPLVFFAPAPSPAQDAATTAPPPIEAQEASLAGSWEGSIEIPGQSLAFDLDFAQQEDGTWIGDISIPAQGAMDVALDAITFAEGKASFRITEIPGEPTFTGEVLAGSLAGTFAQGGASFPFSSSRAGAAAGSEQGPAEAGEESLAGSWEGSIAIPGQSLAFDLDFALQEDGTWAGDISIPVQDTKDLALDDITFAAGKASFRITEIPGEPTFTGEVLAGAMEGTFSQSGASFPFTCTRAGEATAAAQARIDAVRPMIEKALSDHHVPSVGVAVVYKGEVLLADGFGMRDVAQELPADGNTLYSIGSSTKAMTAFAMAQLVDAGELTWDTPIKEVLPAFDMADEYTTDHMTVQDLLTHRSGLPRHDLAWYVSPDATRGDLLEALEHLEPNARLGERFQYQNFMYMTAGLVIESISGQTWEEYTAEHMFQPLGMQTSNFVVPQSAEMASASNSALPYNRDEDTFELDDFYPIAAMGPAGSVRSSANEMAHWVKMLLASGTHGGEELLSPSSVKHLLTAHSSMGAYPSRTDQVSAGYGLGWFLMSNKGHYYAQHGGNIDGFSAMVALYPLDDLGIVVLANRNATGLPGLVALTIADQVLELEAEDWLVVPEESESDEEEEDTDAEDSEEESEALRVEGTQPARPIAAYAGIYEHGGYGQVAVQLASDGKSLIAELGGETWPLEHWHYEVFRTTGEDNDGVLEGTALHFRASARGSIDRVELPLESSLDPIVFLRLPDASLTDPAYLDRLVGKYEVAPGLVLTITRRADVLMVSQNGSPTLDLMPLEGTSFRLEELKGYTLEFEVPEEGLATSLIAYEPGDSTKCMRMTDEQDED